jgi:hypothetical protein
MGILVRKLMDRPTPKHQVEPHPVPIERAARARGRQGQAFGGR